MNITPEMVDALALMREFARLVKRERFPHPVDSDTAKAIDLLDDADFFREIDEKELELEAQGRR
jgi:hypothetical protein